MAKFSRLLLGGIFGAGIAYLFSRKDVRQRLLGGGRPQLPAASETPYGPTAATVSPTAPPASTATPPGPPAPQADLESRIEETRRQVQETLGETGAPGMAAEETAITKTEADLAEAPAVEEAPESAPLEEAPIGEAPAVTPMEEAPVSHPEEDFFAKESPAAEGLEAVKEESSAVQRQVQKEPIPEAPREEEPMAEAKAPGAETVQEFVIEETVEVTEFTDLRTPVAGEPTLAELAQAQEAPAEARGAAEESPEEAEQSPGEAAAETSEPGRASGPAPSQIDRDEMRRRIDETRARLKAKAFDAMVSGETFIEPETAESGLEQKREADMPIEKDLEEHIDKSLKEQD